MEAGMIEARVRKNGRTYSMVNTKKGYFMTVSGRKSSYLGRSFIEAQTLFFSILSEK